MPKIIFLFERHCQDGGDIPCIAVHPDNAIDSSEQVIFYDPGFGTDIGASGKTHIPSAASEPG